MTAEQFVQGGLVEAVGDHTYSFRIGGLSGTTVIADDDPRRSLPALKTSEGLAVSVTECRLLALPGAVHHLSADTGPICSVPPRTGECGDEGAVSVARFAERIHAFRLELSRGIAAGGLDASGVERQRRW